jgi:succinoglycan biosynthesis protein ExoA
MVASSKLGHKRVILHERSIPEGGAASVLVVIPCRNEEEHIGRVVIGLLAEADCVNLKIVVADGGSTDETRSIVNRLAERDSRVILLDNPKRIQSAGLNAAVRTYGDGAKFLIRLDAHADYPPRFCQILLAVQAETHADCVVVTMHTVGKTCFQRATAAAQNSILGNGGSAHRNETHGRWVEHGHHALMTLDAFTTVGGYDESFSHNEDAELDARFRTSGFQIYLTGKAPVIYYPRRSALALFVQYCKIGRGRARNFLKHRKTAGLRHLVLVGIAPLICLVLLAPFSSIFALPALLWAASCLGYGLLLGLRLRDPCAAAAGIAAMATQAGWSFGFFAGLLGALGKSRKDTSACIAAPESRFGRLRRPASPQ